MFYLKWKGMRNLQSKISLINRHIYSGLKFRCRNDIYTFISYDYTNVTIKFFDRLEQIPFNLFYQVMIDDNKDLIEIWNALEQDSVSMIHEL